MSGIEDEDTYLDAELVGSTIDADNEITAGFATLA
jgi:hypothetical protein